MAANLSSNPWRGSVLNAYIPTASLGWPKERKYETTVELDPLMIALEKLDLGKNRFYTALKNKNGGHFSNFNSLVKY